MIPKLNYTPFEAQPKYVGTKPIYDPNELAEERKDICNRLDELLKDLEVLRDPAQVAACNREYDFLLTRLENVVKRHEESEAACLETLAVLKHNEEATKTVKRLKIASLIGAFIVFAKTR